MILTWIYTSIKVSRQNKQTKAKKTKQTSPQNKQTNTTMSLSPPPLPENNNNNKKNLRVLPSSRLFWLYNSVVSPCERYFFFWGVRAMATTSSLETIPNKARWASSVHCRKERKHRALRPQKPLRLIRDGEVGGPEFLHLTPTRYTVTTRTILH